MRKTQFIITASFVLAASGSAFATYNGVQIRERIFNDRPDSQLLITNAYPAFVRIQEAGFGPGGFANRHSAYLSRDGGATAFDIDYADAFDISMTVNHIAQTNVAVEAGFQADLFGFSYFGQLPNGEIAAFGGIFPFVSFGIQPFAASISLRIIHDPGDGDGINPLPAGGTPSTFEYIYDIGGGPVSSGQLPLGGTEGGIPDGGGDFLLGFGAQHNGAAEQGAFADTIFKDIVVSKIPAPGAAGLLALGGLVALRRRR